MQRPIELQTAREQCAVSPHQGDSSDRAGEAPDLPAIIYSLIHECSDPARLLELFYWSQERGALEFMRKFMTLRPKARAILLSFLKMTQDPRLIIATVDEFGQVTLSSAQVAEAVGKMRALEESEPPLPSSERPTK